MNLKKQYQKAFWKSLSAKSYLLILLAVFFTFASIGFVNDLWSNEQTTYSYLVFNVIISGLIAALAVHIAVRNWKWAPVFIILFLALIILVPERFGQVAPDTVFDKRNIVIGFGLFICLMLGYLFFIIFISGEGIRQVKLTTEMDLAKSMHDILVPAVVYKNDRFEIYGQSKPISEVGGDLLDIYQQNDSLVCYTADVSGHGVAASLLMGMFKSAVHTSLQKEKSLAEMINECNRSLVDLKKASMFLTASAIQFEEGNRAYYTVAGHLPIIHIKNETEQFDFLTIKQIPIAVKKDFIFETKQVEFKNNDLFVFVSDGLTEVHNDKNEEFGLEKIARIITNNKDQPLKSIYNKVTDSVNEFGTTHDDQTLMLLKYKVR